jgi:hypothetical protein
MHGGHSDQGRRDSRSLVVLVSMGMANKFSRRSNAATHFIACYAQRNNIGSAAGAVAGSVSAHIGVQGITVTHSRTRAHAHMHMVEIRNIRHLRAAQSEPPMGGMMDEHMHKHDG